MMNIERPTSNAQHRMAASRGIVQRSMFDVRCSMFVFTAVLFAALRLFGQASTNLPPTLSPAYPEIPPPFWEQIGTTVLVAGITLIALAVLILWKLFQLKPEVILPPEIVAREALAKLPRQPGDGKHLSEVSQILRRYVIVAFELPAAELTTAEFCTALAANEKIGTELARTFADFLHECDERKFSSSPAAEPFNAVARALELVSSAEARRSRSAPVPGAAMSPMQDAPTCQQTQHRPDIAASGDGRTPR